jgi:sugar phosphate permease
MPKLLIVNNRWTVVAIAAICMFVIYGIRHSFSAFFPPILDDYGWTRGSTALIFSINVLLYGILSPIAGSLADRWKPKLMMFLGILIIGISTASCALANELWQFYVLFGILLSLGTVFSGGPVMIPVVSRWFTRRRGAAIGIVVAGGALSFSMVTYAEYLISTLDWRLAFVFLAVTAIGICIPLILSFFRGQARQQVKPSVETEELSTSADNNSQESVTAISDYGNVPLIQILKDYRLWLIALAYMLYMGVANYLVVAHQVVFFLDLGYDSLFAASIAGAVGIFAALGALCGFISDRLGRERIFTVCCVLSIISLLILLSLEDASNPWALYIFVLSFGFPMGLFSPALIAGAADLFYGKHFGTVNGILFMGFGIGGAIGPWLGGYIFDITGNYANAFIVCIAAYTIACISFWIAAPRRAKKTK